jgi:colanic acid biosynthesis glycosyl transferase WcaI
VHRPVSHGLVATMTDAIDAADATDLSGLSVLLVCINYPPEVSGIAPYAAAMAHAAQSAGASVRVVTGVPHFPGRRAWPDYRRGIRWEEMVDGVAVSRRRHWVSGRSGFGGRLLQEFTFAAHTLPTVRRSRADVIVAITPAASALAAAVAGRRGRPLGSVVQDLVGNAASQSGTTGSRIGSVIGRVEYWLLRKADLLGVITPRFGKIAVEHGVSDSAVRSLPNFSHVPTSPASREEARELLGWPQDRYLVVHTGNIGKKQGLDVVPRAACLLERRESDIEFVIVGDGNQRDAVEAAASGCTNVRFVGLLSEEQYPLALRAADLLLLCEHPTVLEMSLPSKLTSYVTSGRPLIAAVQDGGITAGYVADHEIAEIVRPGDPEALVEGIERLRAEPARADSLVHHATELATSLQPSQAMLRYVSFIDELRQLMPHSTQPDRRSRCAT